MIRKIVTVKQMSAASDRQLFDLENFYAHPRQLAAAGEGILDWHDNFIYVLNPLLRLAHR